MIKITKDTTTPVKKQYWSDIDKAVDAIMNHGADPLTEKYRILKSKNTFKYYSPDGVTTGSYLRIEADAERMITLHITGLMLELRPVR